MIVKILPNDLSEPPNKLADAELLFEEGVLSGLRLVGFGIWQSRRGKSRSVTVPSRTYFVLGEKRTYALLRPISGEDKVDAVRRLILEAYAEFERRIAGPDAATGDVGAGELFASDVSASDVTTADAATADVAAADVTADDVALDDVAVAT